MDKVHSLIFKPRGFITSLIISIKYDENESDTLPLDMSPLVYERSDVSIENDDFTKKLKTVHHYYTIPKGVEMNTVKITNEFIEYSKVPLETIFKSCEHFWKFQQDSDMERETITILIYKIIS